MLCNAKISIIFPMRNEEKFIGQSLDFIIANDYPKKIGSFGNRWNERRRSKRNCEKIY
ncbi:unnamed protein product [marine sediment metagenome]|uniref:Uncharacterized protein n=1 Tax=marine sediment metagenome TaxID=412755 RepID=X1D3N4_9ZZZZ